MLTTGAFSMRSAQTVPMVGTSKAVKRPINLVDVYQLLNVKFLIPLKDFRTDSSTTQIVRSFPGVPPIPLPPAYDINILG